MQNRAPFSWRWLLLSLLSPLVICFVIFQLYRFPYSVPLAYQGDAYFSAFILKHITTQGFSPTNPLLGFPFGLDMRDFPFNDATYFIGTKLLGYLIPNPFILLNTLYVLSFMSSSGVAWICFRQLGISNWYSFWGGLLFAFLPFHLVRGPYHLYLSSYWLIPIVCTLAVSLLSSVTIHPPEWCYKYRARWLVVALFALLISGSGIYYAVFSMWLLAVAGAVGYLRLHDRRAPILATGIIVIIILGIGVQLFSSVRYFQMAGKNTAVGIRQGFEAEQNSLSLLRMVMPLQDLGISGMAEHIFQPSKPLVDMEQKQFLGWAALLGLGIIVWRTVLQPGTTAASTEKWLSLFVLCAGIFILAMPGGLGTIIAYTLSPQIRSYSRIAPFLAFYAVTGLLWWLDEKDTRQHTSLSLPGTLILIGGLWSQIAWYTPPTTYHLEHFKSDQEFFAQIDQLEPKAVYQLPYKAFPETPNLELLSDYDLLKGYLHSQKPIAWSYASMKGRSGDLWQRTVAQFPLEVQIQIAKENGFEGLYLDRFGWADFGQAVEASASAVIKTPPIISNDGRLVYYQL